VAAADTVLHHELGEAGAVHEDHAFDGAGKVVGLGRKGRQPPVKGPSQPLGGTAFRNVV
jgi:hypothetical protein